jgi:hypothetical protein
MQSKKNKVGLNEITEENLEPKILVNYRSPNVQFISRAKQLTPRSKDVVAVAVSLKDDLKIKGNHSISTRTGNGFLINTGYFESKDFNRDNIVEVIDFDPVRNNMMVIGNDPPAFDSAYQWFIYRGLPWINGVINIDNLDIIEQFSKKYPIVDMYKKISNTDLALTILKTAKSSKICILKNQSVLVVGNTLKEAYDDFKKEYKKLSKHSNHTRD